MTTQIIYGKHSVSLACQNKYRRIFALYCTSNLYNYAKSLLETKYIQCVTKEFLDNKTRVKNHQNIAIETESISYESIHNIHKYKKVLLLDGVQDPHNLGAIIRSMAVFQFEALIIPHQASCKITHTVAKIASGGLEFVKIILVKNISNAMIYLKDVGFALISVNMSSNTLSSATRLNQVAMIIGQENTGISAQNLRKCQYNLCLQDASVFTILNMSVAASLGMYIVNQKIRDISVDII